MVENQAFEDFVEGFGSDQIEYWEDFNTEDTWNFFTSVEEDYDCAGLCYVPLFYLTKDISAGRPEKECIREIIDDVYMESRGLLYGLGFAFLVSGML